MEGISVESHHSAVHRWCGINGSSSHAFCVIAFDRCKRCTLDRSGRSACRESEHDPEDLGTLAIRLKIRLCFPLPRHAKHGGRSEPTTSQNGVSVHSQEHSTTVLTIDVSFKKARVIGPLHTGGPVAISQDGRRLVTCIGEEAILSEVETGIEICRFAGVR